MRGARAPAHGRNRARDEFASAAAAFVEVVAACPTGSLGEPALGTWSVRDLIGHTSRALSTVEDYLGRDVPGAVAWDPIVYMRTMLPASMEPAERTRRDEEIARRGREAGAALGNDPPTAVRALAARVVARVEASDDAAIVGTPAGPMTLASYLPTRTFELAVHTLDLCAALEIEPPGAIGPAVRGSLLFAAALAGDHDGAAEVLRALCGRGALPPGYSAI